MFKVNPYLNFNGTCEDAFNFYKSIFGGSFTSLMRFKDMPPSEELPPASDPEKIMHVSLPINESTVLMGSDIFESKESQFISGNNIYISLSPDNKDEAQNLYDKLSAGGSIEMPFAKMFWGAWFASFTDKYGIQWMIDFEDS